MGQNWSEKMGVMTEKTTNKSKNTKNNNLGQEAFEMIDIHVLRDASLL